MGGRGGGHINELSKIIIMQVTGCYYEKQKYTHKALTMHALSNHQTRDSDFFLNYSVNIGSLFILAINCLYSNFNSKKRIF